MARSRVQRPCRSAVTVPRPTANDGPTSAYGHSHGVHALRNTVQYHPGPCEYDLQTMQKLQGKESKLKKISQMRFEPICERVPDHFGGSGRRAGGCPSPTPSVRDPLDVVLPSTWVQGAPGQMVVRRGECRDFRAEQLRRRIVDIAMQARCRNEPISAFPSWPCGTELGSPLPGHSPGRKAAPTGEPLRPPYSGEVSWSTWSTNSSRAWAV